MFKATRALAMQPTRMMFMRRSPQLYMQQTVRMMKSAEQKEPQSAHTISQRIKQLKKIPAELIPLGIVLAAAVGMAIFSLGRKLVVDKTLRLKRSAGDNGP